MTEQERENETKTDARDIVKQKDRQIQNLRTLIIRQKKEKKKKKKQAPGILTVLDLPWVWQRAHTVQTKQEACSKCRGHSYPSLRMV